MKQKLLVLLNSWSVRLVALATVIGISAFFEIREKNAVMDADIWTHLSVGDWIWQYKSIPRTGLFSQAAQQPWMAYSWGFEVLVSAFHRSFGLAGLLTLLVIFEVAISLALFVAAYRLSNRYWWSLACAGAGIWAIYHAITIRPVLFTVLFYTAVLAILLHVRRGRGQRALWLLFPIFVVWANVHIQFVYGLFIVAAFAMEAVVQGWLRRYPISSELRTNSVPPLEAVIACGACFLATLLGPYSIQVYRIILGLGSNTKLYDQISELMAMNFRLSGHYVELFIVMAAALVLGRTRKWDLFGIAVLASAAVFSFRSTRDAWFVCVSALLIASDNLPEKAETDHPRSLVLVGLSATALTLVALLGFAVTSGVNNQTMLQVVRGAFPVSAAEFVRSRGLPGPLYNNMGFGGFLDWYLPEYPTSIDGRTDLAGEDRLTLHVDVLNGRVMPLEDPRLRAARVVILDRHYPLSATLRQVGIFSLIYQDQLAVVYVRTAN